MRFKGPNMVVSFVESTAAQKRCKERLSAMISAFEVHWKNEISLSGRKHHANHMLLMAQH